MGLGRHGQGMEPRTGMRNVEPRSDKNVFQRFCGLAHSTQILATHFAASLVDRWCPADVRGRSSEASER